MRFARKLAWFFIGVGLLLAFGVVTAVNVYMAQKDLVEGCLFFSLEFVGIGFVLAVLTGEIK